MKTVIIYILAFVITTLGIFMYPLAFALNSDKQLFSYIVAIFLGSILVFIPAFFYHKKLLNKLLKKRLNKILKKW
jgi:amino acid permease